MKNATRVVCLFAAALAALLSTTEPAFAQATNTFPSSGDVGIGTTSPAALLQVASTSAWPSVAVTGGTTTDGAEVTLVNSDVSREFSLGVGGSSNTSVPSSLFLYDNTASAFRMVVDSSGNVGIGTTSPGFPLQVAGQVYFSSAVAGAELEGTNTNGTSGNGILGKNSGVNYYCYLGTVSYSLLCNGPTSGISDQRLKKNIHPLAANEGLDAVMKLRPVHYLWKDERMNKAHPDGEIGFIAQDVEAVLPLLVAETKQPDDAEIKLPDGKQKSLEYDRLAAPVVLAIQQQQAEIADLRQTLSELKQTTTTLSAALAKASMTIANRLQ